MGLALSRTRLLAPFLTSGLLAVLIGCGVRQPAAATETTALRLRVLATHDFHGALLPVESVADGRPVGGAAALKAVMDDLQDACACPTIRVDGGDQMQGTLESNLAFGAPVVAAFNLVGLDAAAVGNHELDWSIDTLLARRREARYAWLAANVFRVDDGTRPEWAPPFTIVERDGVKVGVIGYATVQTPRTLRPAATAAYEFRSGYAAIRDALDAVWRERPDFVVIAAHAAGGCDERGCAGEMVELASQLPPGRVHLIVGGHDHEPGGGIVNAIPIVRAGSNGRAVGVIDLTRSADGVHAFEISQQPVLADAVEPDAAMIALLASAVAAAEDKRRELVTTLAQPLSSSAAGDRELGTLIAEAARLLGNADIGLHNPGGVRTSLARGPVSYSDLHRTMPFDNAVVTLALTGEQVRQLVERVGPRYYFANLRVERDGEDARRVRHLSLIAPEPAPIRDEQTYRLATNDFLADGGDGLTLLPTLSREVTGVLLLDAVVAHLRSLPTPLVLPEARRE